MLPAPSLWQVEERLRDIPHDPWGPDHVRYVCFLFWNELGLRLLRNTVQEANWREWHASSGDFWDLFLAGCYRGKDHPGEGPYGDEVFLSEWADSDGAHLVWSAEAARSLIRDVHQKTTDTHGRWRFAGPLELAVVGARRAGSHVDIDWESLRAANVGAERLGDAVAYYTEAHIRLDPEVLDERFPAPGDFTDDLPPDAVVRLMIRRVPVLTKLFRQVT